MSIGKDNIAKINTVLLEYPYKSRTYGPPLVGLAYLTPHTPHTPK
jgi:hypothetical protein